MKVTVTYKTCTQISPDDWATYTEVIPLQTTDTMEDAYNKITKGWRKKMKADVELHFLPEEDGNES